MEDSLVEDYPFLKQVRGTPLRATSPRCFGPNLRVVTQRTVERRIDVLAMCEGAILDAAGWWCDVGGFDGLYASLLRALARTHDYRQYWVKRDGEATIEVHRIVPIPFRFVVDSCVTQFIPKRQLRTGLGVRRQLKVHCFRLCKKAYSWRGHPAPKTTEEYLSYVFAHGGHEDELCITEDSEEVSGANLYRCFQWEQEERERIAAEAEEDAADGDDEDDAADGDDADGGEDDADGGEDEEDDADGGEVEDDDVEDDADGDEDANSTDMDSDDGGIPFPRPPAPSTPVVPKWGACPHFIASPASSTEY